MVHLIVIQSHGGDPKPQYKNVSLKEAFSTYIKMLMLYPDVVIKDRLDGMNLIWDIRADILLCPVRIVGDVSYKEATLPDGIIGSTASRIKNLAASLYQISMDEQVINILMWKNGIYIYILLVTALFLFQNKRSRLLWTILPSVFILFTYILVIAWQMYFYIWFFPLSVTLLLVVSIVECERQDNDEKGFVRLPSTD